jgi:hypothetical protein
MQFVSLKLTLNVKGYNSFTFGCNGTFSEHFGAGDTVLQTLFQIKDEMRMNVHGYLGLEHAITLAAWETSEVQVGRVFDIVVDGAELGHCSISEIVRLLI